MALLTTLTSKRATNGNDLVGVAAAAGGDTFTNTGQEIAVITNGSGAPITVTFVTQATVDGLAVADLTAAIPAGATHAVGPFPTSTYNDGSGLVSMTYSGVTTLTVAILKVAPA